MKQFVVSALAALTLLTGLGPAYAVPLSPIAGPAASSNIELAQYRYRPRPGWYHGHHGYRYYRPGYRRHSDGWWYPLAAFGAGALIGGAIASQPSAPPPQAGAGINPRHIAWCSSRYRTYRAYDNTYAPAVGVRAQCYSPYY